MTNYEAIKKSLDLEDIACFCRQITLLACKKQINELPTQEDWEEYLLSNSIFLPFN